MRSFKQKIEEPTVASRDYGDFNPIKGDALKLLLFTYSSDALNAFTKVNRSFYSLIYAQYRIIRTRYERCFSDSLHILHALDKARGIINFVNFDIF